MTSLYADQIMRRAREAQPGWASLPVARRCSWLGRLRRLVARDCERIAKILAEETSKPLLDALSGDVMVTLEMMRYYESHAPGILQPRRIGKPMFFFQGTSFERTFEPHGVVLIFGAYNYPLQLSVVPLVTALTAGNAVVLKVSERTPRTAAMIEALCAEADLPAGLVQVLHGEPADSAALIDAVPDSIFFTGSSENGRAVAQRAARHLIPAVLELGGKDAALVFADCNMQRAMEGITYGAFSNAGRVCVGIKRAYVEESIHLNFVDRLRERIAALNVGSDAHADLYPLPADESALLRAQVEDAMARGARLHWPPDLNSVGSTPVLLTDVDAQSRLLTEETFGPVLCVAPFRDEAHALSLANDSRFALSGSVWTSDRQRARRVAAAITSGSCAVNDVVRVIANPRAPFGGNRHSGYGRYHGPEGLLAFSRTKTLMLANGRSNREVHWFPFSAATSRQLIALLRLRHGPAGLLASLLRRVGMLALASACVLPIAAAQTASGAALDIRVQLTPNAHGDLAYLVFRSAEGFPNDRARAIQRGFIPIPHGAGQMEISLRLPPGTYAASVYEDLNSNHELDHNFFGIPREPVGASNNPRARKGPPRFEDCSFTIGDKPKTITISVVPGL